MSASLEVDSCLLSPQGQAGVRPVAVGTGQTPCCSLRNSSREKQPPHLQRLLLLPPLCPAQHLVCPLRKYPLQQKRQRGRRRQPARWKAPPALGLTLCPPLLKQITSLVEVNQAIK